MAAAGHVAAAGFALLAVAALAVVIGFQASSGSLAALEQKRVDWAKQREQFEHDAKQDKRDGHDAGVLVHAMLSRKGHESLGVAERHLDAATMDVRPGANKRTLDSLSGSLRSYADALARADARMGTRILDVHDTVRKHGARAGDGYLAYARHVRRATARTPPPPPPPQAKRQLQQGERHAAPGRMREAGLMGALKAQARAEAAREALFPAFADKTVLKSRPFRALGNLNLVVDAA